MQHKPPKDPSSSTLPELGKNDRAVSFVVQYILTSVILIAIFTAATALVLDTTESTEQDIIDSEYERIGEKVVQNLESTSTRASEGEFNKDYSMSNSDPALKVSLTLPNQIGDHQYSVSVTPDEVIVSPSDSRDRNKQYRTPHDVDQDITGSTTFSGGSISIIYTGEDELEIERSENQ